MGPKLALLLLLIVLASSTTAQPSPGYSPTAKIPSLPFPQAYRNLWGPTHQTLSGGSLTLRLDSSSGSGFKSLRPYRSGYFGAAIKLHSGYTAGVITSLYLSNGEDHPGDHDEIDIEFLGTIPGRPYVLQTNVYMRGSGDGDIVGREVKCHLWFDPTLDFHNYAIQWTSYEIIFFVDDVPIRRYPRKSDATFPLRPMYVYGSIWDASSWATDNGRYTANYRYQPFFGTYKNFKVRGCAAAGPASCRAPSVSPAGSGGLSPKQFAALNWFQSKYSVYNYCHDPKRDRSQIPEC